MMQEDRDYMSDLFGALIHSKLYRASSLYESMDVRLSMPLLRDRVHIHTSQSHNSSHVDDSDDRTTCSDCTAPADKDNSDSKPAALTGYITLTTKEEFCRALYADRLLNRSAVEFSETKFTVACLQALRGIDTISAFLNPKTQYIVPGYTLSCLRLYASVFYKLLQTRVLLNSAINAFCSAECTDPAQQALGVGVEDLLHVCDSSLSSFEQYLMRSGKTITLPALWQAVQNEVRVLRHILHCIAPTPLLTEIEKCGVNGNSDSTPVFTSYMQHPGLWLKGEVDDIGYPTGWEVLEMLLRCFQRLEGLQLGVIQGYTPRRNVLRTAHSRLRSFIPITASLDVGKVHHSAADSASDLCYCICATLFLLRRVSVPLLSEVERIVFHMHASAEVVRAHRISMRNKRMRKWWSSSRDSAVEPVKTALLWGVSRMDTTSVPFRRLLERAAAQNSEGINLELVFPIHPLDVAVNRRKTETAEKTYQTLLRDVRDAIGKWADSKIEVEDGTVVDKDSHCDSLEGNMLPDPGTDVPLAQDVTSELPEDHAEESVSSESVSDMTWSVPEGLSDAAPNDIVDVGVGITPRRVTREELQVAEASLRDKYSQLMDTADKRLQHAQWLKNQKETLAIRQKQLHILLYGHIDSTDITNINNNSLSLRHHDGGDSDVDGETINAGVRSSQHVHQAPGGDSSLSLRHHDGGDSDIDGETINAGVRSSQHVHQAPGGDSSLSLRHHDGGDSDIDGETINAGVRSSQHVHQAPGGDSSLSLRHHDGGDSDVNGETIDIGVRSSQHVHQAPGGDSSLSLRHHDGGDSDIDGETINAGVRSSQHVHQAPGGDSSLSLRHHDGGDSDIDGETIDIGVRSSQHVHQAPGGDSSLSLRHHDGGDSDIDGETINAGVRSSQHVHQAPGGDSSLSLRHHDGGDSDVNGETINAGVRSSQHVHQAPGGDSSLSLRHHDGGDSDIDGETIDIGVRSSQHVHQAPGGNSSLSLRHHDGGESDIDGETIDIGVRSSQHVHQAPGGDSSLSLRHRDGGDSDVNGETIDIGVRSSQHVHQAPGGDSSLSLRHHDGGESDIDGETIDIGVRSSQHVHQAPGGDSSLSLRHHDGGDSDIDGETIDIGVHSSQHVHQAPGGDSSLSLRHHDGGESDIEGETIDIGVRSSQHVHQAPGGDSSLSLRHHDGGDSDIDGATIDIGVRSSQHVHQAPGGDSSLSLRHHDGGDSDIDGATIDIGVRSSQHVHQAPGGDSSLSLRHHDGGESDIDGATIDIGVRSSQHVHQAPGGNSSLSLRHHDGGDSDIDGGKSGDSSVVFSDSVRDCGFAGKDFGIGDEELVNSGGTDVDMSFNSGVRFSESRVHEDENDYLSALKEFYSLDEWVTSAEDNFLEKSCFRQSISDLCRANNIPFLLDTDNCDDKRNPDSSLLSTFSLLPSTCVVRDSLCAPIRTQCLAIDQAFLLGAIQDTRLLDYIDCLHHIFLLSDQSNFLVTIGGILVDTHIQANCSMRFSKIMSGSITVTQPDVPPQRPSHLWSSRAVAAAFCQALSQQPNEASTDVVGLVMADEEESSAGKRTLMTDDEVKEEHQRAAAVPVLHTLIDGHSNAIDVVDGFRYKHLIGAFSIEGLQKLKVRFEPPWPLSMMLSGEHIDALSLVTRRLLELSQLTALSRHTWGDLHRYRVRGRSELAYAHYSAKEERFFFSAFRQIRQAFQAVAHFNSDRLRGKYAQLKGELYAASPTGFGHFMEVLRHYIYDIVDATFVSSGVPRESIPDDYDLLCESLSALLDSCRVALLALHKACIDIRTPNSDHLATALSIMRSRIAAIRLYAESDMMWNDKNAECLIMYMESAE